jgi:hypothetical protein
MHRMRLTLVFMPLLLTASTGCDDEIIQDAIPTSDAAHEGGSDAGAGETSSEAAGEEVLTEDADAASAEGGSDAPTE